MNQLQNLLGSFSREKRQAFERYIAYREAKGRRLNKNLRLMIAREDFEFQGDADVVQAVEFAMQRDQTNLQGFYDQQTVKLPSQREYFSAVEEQSRLEAEDYGQEPPDLNFSHVALYNKLVAELEAKKRQEVAAQAAQDAQNSETAEDPSN